MAEAFNLPDDRASLLGFAFFSTTGSGSSDFSFGFAFLLVHPGLRDPHGQRSNPRDNADTLRD